MYVITGASGHIGSGVADILLSEGKKVRVIGRSAERLAPLVKKGAEAFPGDMLEPQFLTRAFKGARAVFVMIPPNPGAEDLRAYQNRITDNIIAAIKDVGVRSVVNLSSMGAQLTDKSGPILGLHDQEERLNEVPGLQIVHLRPGYFMENLFGSIEMIRKGMFGGAMKADLKIPLIATRDIATEAAKYLQHLDFKGISVRELLGERDISMDEVAGIIGEAIGNPKLKYTQFPYENMVEGLLGAGFSHDVAQSFADMARSANEGILYRGTGRTGDSTTKTPFEDFVKTFAVIVKRAA